MRFSFKKIFYSGVFFLLVSCATTGNLHKIDKKAVYKNFKVQYTKLSTGSNIGYMHFSNENSDKLPLIVLHGGPGGGVTKRDLQIGYYLYRKNIDVYFFDQAGVGWSDNIPVNEYTVDRMVRDLEALRNSLHLEKINLYGKSFGGAYALAYALEYPKNTGSIILENSGGYGQNKTAEDENESKGRNIEFYDNVSPRLRDFFQSMQSANSIVELEKDFSQDEMKYLFTKYINIEHVENGSNCPDNQLSESQKHDDDYMRTSNFNVYANLTLSSDMKKQDANNLRNVKNKVLFFKGECDYLPRAIFNDFERKIPNFTGVEIKKRGHSAFLDFDGENTILDKAVSFLE